MTTHEQTQENGIDAPEAVNRSQQDEDAQSQMLVGSENTALTTSARLTATEQASGDVTTIVPQDSQDLVDHMTQMARSGLIDYSAYRGEPVHDDEEGSHGKVR